MLYIVGNKLMSSILSHETHTKNILNRMLICTNHFKQFPRSYEYYVTITYITIYNVIYCSYIYTTFTCRV